MATAKQKAVLTEREAMLVEEIANCVAEIRQATLDAESGSAIDVCEGLTVEAIRKFGPRIIENSVQAKIDAVEKKGRRAERVVGKTLKVKGADRSR